MKKQPNLAGMYISRVRMRLLKNNQNWLAIICGGTGSGKSYSALSIADTICPRGITVRRNVVFNSTQFLRKLVDKNQLQKGDIIIFDEAGVGMSSREWYSVQNKLLGSVLQTFRNMNVGVIFTTPNLSFIDVQARKLFHNYFETVYLDYEEELAYLKCRDIQHNSLFDKTYYKKPRFNNEGLTTCMDFIAIPKPREALIKEYEEVKNEYTEELNLNALNELTGKNKPVKKDLKQENQKVINKVKEEPSRFIAEYQGRKYIDSDLLKNEFNLSHRNANTIKKAVEKDIDLKQTTHTKRYTSINNKTANNKEVNKKK